MISYNASFPDSLSARQFDRLNAIVSSYCGFSMSSAMKIVLDQEVVFRVRSLGLRSAGDYLDRLETYDTDSRWEDELLHLINTATADTMASLCVR